MISTFSVNLILAFIVGGVWITITTVLAEKFGSKLGGFVGGLPSTVVVALFFIGLNQSPQIASTAANVIPVVEGIGGLFLSTYAILVRRNFVLAMSVALLLWFALSASVVIFNIRTLLISFVLYVPMLLLSYYILEMRLRIKSLKKVAVKYTPFRVISRACFGGVVIAFAVFVGKYGGPILGGAFSAFPAMFISTIVLTKISGGVEFSRAVTKPLMLSGLITVVAYSTAASMLFPTFGIWLGTAGAYLISIPFSYITYLFIRRNLI